MSQNPNNDPIPHTQPPPTASPSSSGGAHESTNQPNCHVIPITSHSLSPHAHVADALSRLEHDLMHDNDHDLGTHHQQSHISQERYQRELAKFASALHRDDSPSRHQQQQREADQKPDTLQVGTGSHKVSSTVQPSRPLRQVLEEASHSAAKRKASELAAAPSNPQAFNAHLVPSRDPKVRAAQILRRKRDSNSRYREKNRDKLAMKERERKSRLKRLKEDELERAKLKYRIEAEGWRGSRQHPK